MVQTRFAIGTLAMLRSDLGEDLNDVANQARHVLDDEAVTRLAGARAVEVSPILTAALLALDAASGRT